MKTRTLNIATILCMISTILSAKTLNVDKYLNGSFWANSYAEHSFVI